MDLSSFLGKKLKEAIDAYQLIYLYQNDVHFIRIIDLPKLWMSHQDLYYLPEDDIVGSLDTLVMFKTLADKLDSAVTGYNYEQNQLFYKKLKEFDDWMIQTLKENQHTPGQTVTDLVAVSHKNQKSSTQAILDKLEKIPFGYYMDVSDVNKLKYLKGTAKKFVAPNIRIISNNYDNFNYVIHLLPQGATKYAEDLQKAQIYFNIKNVDVTSTGLLSKKDEGVPVKIVKQGTKYKREPTFLQKLNALPQNKYLDVSLMNNKGQAISTIDKSQMTNDYYIATDLNIVSNNYDHFMKAINMIPNGTIKYEGDVVLAKMFFNIESSEESSS